MTPERLAEIRALLAEPMKTYSVDAAQLHSCGRDLLAHIDTLAGEWRPLSEWHEDMGPKLWHKFPVKEPPYVGTPLDLGQTVEVTVRAVDIDKMMRVSVGGWPGYHTHFTALLYPAPPKPEVTP